VPKGMVLIVDSTSQITIFPIKILFKSSFKLFDYQGQGGKEESNARGVKNEALEQASQ
jgi:hypothetical protein